MESVKPSMKTIGKKVLTSFLYLAIFILIVRIFHPRWYVLILGICAYQLGLAVYVYHTRGEFSWRSVLQGWFMVLVFAALFSFIYSFGWVGFWIDVTLTAGYILIFRWKDYVTGVEEVETKIYGHPSRWYKENRMPLPKIKLIR